MRADSPIGAEPCEVISRPTLRMKTILVGFKFSYRNIELPLRRNRFSERGSHGCGNAVSGRGSLVGARGGR